MSYLIYKTDSSLVAEVVDGTVDQEATALTLIGKNATSYGEFFNENFVKLLENFANSDEPTRKITGQLWYDTSEGRLKVYDGNGFKVSGGTIVAESVPSSISQGDIFINNKTAQLFFNDGNSTVLGGPLYTKSQGVSGFRVDTVFGKDSQNHTVVMLYVAQQLIGIFSKETFTPATPITGYGTEIQTIEGLPVTVSLPINPGFNQAVLTGMQFDVPVSQARYLIAADGTTKKYPENFIPTRGSSAIQPDAAGTATLNILSNKPLVLGPSSDVEVSFAPYLFTIGSRVDNQNIQLSTRNPQSQQISAIFIKASTNKVGIFNTDPQATLHVGTSSANGSVIIEGDLTVRGATTTISTTNTLIKDLNITLGDGVITDGPGFNAGGGITLKGATDKTLTWSYDYYAWSSNQHFNLDVTKTYKIAGASVLSASELGAGVVTAKGLTTIESTLNYLKVDTIKIDGNVVSYNVDDVEPVGDIVLEPKDEQGNVDVTEHKIVNLGYPRSNQDLDAINVGYLKLTVRSQPLGTMLTVTGLTDEQIALIIADMYPPANYELNTLCRVHCYSAVGHPTLPGNPNRYVKIYTRYGAESWVKIGDDIASLLT